MVRRAVVRPRPGDVTVTRDDVMQALSDAEAVLWTCGGGLQVITQRVRADEVLHDGLQGEAYTTAVIIEWRDRTDARQQPEHTAPARHPAQEPDPQPDLEDVEVEEDTPVPA